MMRMQASMVKLAKEKLHGKTLAIGDGANDVSMLQCADVGVGIEGPEGMQASMASDFALARFKFLQRLLLVHGHWCYDRLVRIALHIFHKSAVSAPLSRVPPSSLLIAAAPLQLYVYTLFWFQLHCGYSGQPPADVLFSMLYDVLATSVPPILLGIADQVSYSNFRHMCIFCAISI